MRTTECSWRLCPIPGMYAVTSIPFERRTRATFLKAELGFFGVTVMTFVQTPRFCGHPSSAGDLVLCVTFSRPFLTSWLMVGIMLTLLTVNDAPVWPDNCRIRKCAIHTKGKSQSRAQKHPALFQFRITPRRRRSIHPLLREARLLQSCLQDPRSPPELSRS